MGLVELRSAQPLVNLRTTARRQVLLTNLASVVFGFAMFAMSLVVPQVVQLPTATGYGLGRAVGTSISSATAGVILAQMTTTFGPITVPSQSAFEVVMAVGAAAALIALASRPSSPTGVGFDRTAHGRQSGHMVRSRTVTARRRDSRRSCGPFPQLLTGPTHRATPARLCPGDDLSGREHAATAHPAVSPDLRSLSTLIASRLRAGARAGLRRTLGDQPEGEIPQLAVGAPVPAVVPQVVDKQVDRDPQDHPGDRL